MKPTDQEILRNVHSDYKSAEIVKDDNDNKVAKWINVWDSKPYGTEVAGKSQYVSAMTKTLGNWQIPSLVEPFTSSDEIVETKQTGPSDRPYAQQSAAWLNYQFCRDFPRFQFMTDLCTDITKRGTCFIKTGWDFREEEVDIEVPVFEKDIVTGTPIIVGYETQTVVQTVANKPTAELRSLLDIRMDPTCKGDIEKAAFIIDDFETSLSELTKDGRYHNLDKIMKELERDDTWLKRESTDDTFTFQDDARKKFIVHEYWGQYDMTGDGIATPMVIAWVGDVIIRMEENPFPGQKLPFVRAVYTKVPDMIYGEPLAAAIEKEQKIDSVLHRGIFDDMKLANNGQRGTRKGFTDDANMIKFKRGDDFEFNTGMGDVWENKYQPLSNSVLTILDRTAVRAESNGGIKAFQHGTGGNSLGSTAAAVNATTTSSAKREMQIIRGIAEYALIPMFRRWLEYSTEFMDPEEFTAITEMPYVEPNIAAKDGRVDFKLSIATQESKALKAERLAFLLQTMGPSMDPHEARIIQADILRLNDMPGLAKKLEEFQPQPDPMAIRIQELQIAKLEAEVFNEQQKGLENQADIALKKAKERNEIAKARNFDSKSDKEDLDFLEKEAGADQVKELQKITAKAQTPKGVPPSAESANK